MNSHVSTHLNRYISALVFLFIFSDASANGWTFDSNDEGCILSAKIYDKETGDNLATLGMIKFNNEALSELKDFGREVFLSDTGFILETKKRNLKIEKGVDVLVSSESMSAYINYLENSKVGRDDFVYTLSSGDSLNIIDAVSNDEYLSFEFNTNSSRIKYGIIRSENFVQSYKEFDQCVKILN